MGPRLDTTHYDVVYLILHDVSWTSLDTIQAYLHCDRPKKSNVVYWILLFTPHLYTYIGPFVAWFQAKPYVVGPVMSTRSINPGVEIPC
jgi:hypothetical protein